MRIYYGTSKLTTIDITDSCYENRKLRVKNNIIRIPCNDCIRASFFSDPYPNILKKIFIDSGNCNDKKNIIEIDAKTEVEINIITCQIKTITEEDIHTQWNDIQSSLQLNHGSFQEELPEQKMVVRYLTGTEKVLEIGGNIGRNSLMISRILGENSQTNFVSLECDMNIANQLCENRDSNLLKFHIEPSALSKRKLIQKGWETMVSDVLLDGYSNVNTITLDELHLKYNIEKVHYIIF